MGFRSLKRLKEEHLRAVAAASARAGGTRSVWRGRSLLARPLVREPDVGNQGSLFLKCLTWLDIPELRSELPCGQWVRYFALAGSLVGKPSVVLFQRHKRLRLFLG